MNPKYTIEAAQICKVKHKFPIISGTLKLELLKNFNFYLI